MHGPEDEFPEIAFELRDGRRGVVRRAGLGNEEGMLAVDREVTAAGEGVVMSVEELRDTVDHLRDDLADYESGERGALIVAEVDGEIAGWGRLRRHRPSKLRHSVRLSLGVRPAFQGQGVGGALMEGMIAWARWIGDVSRIELCVFADNGRAVRLYERAGFRAEGRHIGVIREPDGRVRDDMTMALLLD